MAGKSGRNPQGRAQARPVGTPSVDPDVFKGLTVSVESEPLPRATRDTGPNPFAEAVESSFGDDAPAYGAVVPEAAKQRAVYLIRKAARDRNYGVRIIEDAPENGNVKLRFKAKPKKQRREEAPASA